ncbi:MAG: hypothetical protein PWP64_1609 [Candidatus Cloacimonadota bacterium]|nr:hypothetical protein [Candidatus Cloacimonadota bacterium]
MLLMSLTLMAKFVNPAQAVQVAQNWMTFWQRGATPELAELQSYESGQISTLDLFAQTEEPELYLLYFADGSYAVVPADDNLRPVLAYSTQPLQDKNDMPPAFLLWLKYYASDVRYAREHQYIHPENPGLFAAITSNNFSQITREREVSPLIKTNWNQDYPYNELCPADPSGPGGRVYAGCVATAMAQLMKYWNAPITGEGAHSYYANGYGYQSVNFGQTTYLWDEMPNSASLSTLPVATLIYHAAVSVDMGFSPTGSGSNGMRAQAALQDYFQYPDASYVQKYNYSATNWENLLKAQLDNGVPMYYSGMDTDAGHAWNLDGYQGSNYFHFNFGWSGAYNGYYYLNSITPGANNFNASQSAIINAIPENYTITKPRIQVLAENAMAGHAFELKLTTYPILSSWNVTNFSLSLFYEPNLVQFQDAQLNGTIAEAGELFVDSSEPGYVHLAWNGENPLFGAGDLIKFIFQAIEPGNPFFSPVDMAFNAQILQNVEALIMEIEAPVSELSESTISLSNAMHIPYNELATMNMSTSYLPPSWNVNHYEFVLNYDPVLIEFQDCINAATLSEHADNLQSTLIEPGVTQVVYDSAETLTGFDSLLLKIRFRAIGNISSPLPTQVTISDFYYNTTPIPNTSGGIILLAPSTATEDDFPTALMSLRNYPNPFNPTTNIELYIPKSGLVDVAIYNLKGQKIATLHHGQLAPGEHKFVWQGKDDKGQDSGSGIYLLKINANGESLSRKLSLIK